MKVLVMTAVDENERDIHIVLAARIDGVNTISPVITMPGIADRCTGNPYLVFGDVVSDFTGCDKYETSISVFACRSGCLNGWEPGWERTPARN